MQPGPPDEEGAESLVEGILQRTESTTAPADDTFELLTFLFADIRGYTKFTQQRGDEAAAKLTAKFATVVHDLVADAGGTVVELRGDEALCVFRSPRQCLRLAVALQQRFVAETAADPDLPMPVGIGIDAGEAVRLADGYRGGALNLAARLCAQAKAGQILASQEVTHLARTIDGVRYTLLDRITVRGLPDPVRPVQVRPAGEDPALQLAALLIEPNRGATRVRWLPGPLASRPRLALSALAAVAVLAASLVVVLVRDSGGQQLSAFAENHLGIIDPTNGRLVGQVDIPDGPTAVAAGFGFIWTANIDANSVAKVDPSTLEVVDTIPVGVAPTAITAGLGSMWVVNSGDGTVSRINRTSDNPQTIPVGNVPSGVVVANGSVWVTNSADGTVSRIDPSQNSAGQPIPVGSGPRGISAGDDIWVANSASDTTTRIDGRGASSQTINVGCSPDSLTVVGTSVWVLCTGDSEITQIATTGAPNAKHVDLKDQPGQLAADENGHIWTTLQGSRAVVEVDPAVDQVIRTVPVGPIPGGIAAAEGKLWVTTTIDPARHKGGTLHLVGQVKSIDPVYPVDPNAVSILASSYDGLLSFRRASGADGFSMVPDLATAIPEPTDGGRSYTFQLRDGIRWSTGQPVTVSDVKRGIERLAASGQTPLARLLVGAGRCTTKRCDISGITANNTARTVTIRLVHPSGDLLDLLANGCYAMPPGTPLAEHDSRPIPATGPYRISYVPDKIVVLTRNPYFHEWSAAAQPDGFPDTIEYRVMPPGGSKQAIDGMAAAQTDWIDALERSTHLAYSVSALKAQFGTRLRMTPAQTMFGVFLNTRLPPFNDPDVRRALAYAIDRRAVVDHWLGPGAVTCQFLPPDYPGYRPYCPYTSNAGADSWQGSDVPKAQDLLTDRHPERTPVRVWATPDTKRGFQDVVDALVELGYNAHLRVWPNNSWYEYSSNIVDPSNHVQAGFAGWLNGDASAASMLSAYRCDAIDRKHPNSWDNQNLAQFCHPSLDRLMNRADRVQATSVARAGSLWAEVERRLVNAAPWIPLINPSSVDVLSARVHNYKRSPVFGPLFDQMWVVR